MMSPLPTLNFAYSICVQEESQRMVVGTFGDGIVQKNILMVSGLKTYQAFVEPNSVALYSANAGGNAKFKPKNDFTCHFDGKRGHKDDNVGRSMESHIT